MVPDGVWMVRGDDMGRLLQTGVVLEKKWMVQPESAMAKKGVVGGPVTEAHWSKLVDGMVVTCGTRLVWCAAVGNSFPPPHSGLGQRRLDMMVLLPPCMFLTAAAVW